MGRLAALSWVLLGMGLMGSCGSRSGLRVFEEDAGWGPPDPIVDAAVEETGPSFCVSMTIDYQPHPATVLMLIDRSGSMDNAFGGTTRWDAVGDALFAPTDGVLATMGATARFGMTLYTSLDGFSGGACPSLIEVPIAMSNGAAIEATWNTTWPMPDGDTPTGEAIEAATRTLLAFGPPGPKYILLVTDGEPDTCAVPDPQTGQVVAIEAAAAAHAAGIRLLILGVSGEVLTSHIQQMANAGAGVDTDLVWGVDAQAAQPFRALGSSVDLANQLRGVLGAVRACEVDLGGTVDPDLANEARLRLDGSQLGHLDPDGWRLVDDDSLELIGDACDLVQSSGQVLEIEYPCD